MFFLTTELAQFKILVEELQEAHPLQGGEDEAEEGPETENDAHELTEADTL